MKARIFPLAALALVGCGSESAKILIENPCDTFVAEAAPTRTPSLRRDTNGQLLLEISFTPAESEEATKIYEAVKRRATTLRIAKTGREIKALRVGAGSIIVLVTSKEEAEAILVELCFKKSELIVALGMPNQTPEPTTTLVTPRAGARVAPSAVVAHL